MRTFHRRERYPISRENEIATFKGELDYYRTHNTFPVVLFGKNITNIYRNINVQVVITKKCNFHCQFCIENDGITGGRVVESCPSLLLDQLLDQYKSQGIEPCISITGGEPTLYPDRLIRVLEVAKKHGITKVNINTNGGRLLGLENVLDGIRINLSRHHFLPEKNLSIFGNSNVNPLILNKNYIMQCVMMKGYIDSVEEMKKYMAFFSCSDVGGFSFRGLSKLDAGKEYSKEVNFSAAHAVDFFSIVDQISNDPDFEFIQQKIGDHYWFEIYKYKGKIVRLTYSNFEFLRQVETEERNRGEWFSRATIVSPFGKVYAGWTYDINKIVG